MPDLIGHLLLYVIPDLIGDLLPKPLPIPGQPLEKAGGYPVFYGFIWTKVCVAESRAVAAGTRADVGEGRGCPPRLLDG